ncbi:MAG: FAD binding domain-containing protein [Rhodospirillaceae bacterium]|nr:FAD binding domain-containing protein [Rhodospirillaceae bacterium]
MKPVPFDYARPETLEEALALMANYGDDAAPLAGGLSLGPMLNLRLARPAVVVDLGRLALHEIDSLSPDRPVETGALVRQAFLQQRLKADLIMPLVGEALDCIGHYQTRARGTVGGSVAHADPAAELPLCLVTMDGSIWLQSTAGRRNVPATAFFEAALTTARHPDELVAGLEWPDAGEPGAAFAEFALRHGDFAIVAAAAIVRRSDDGRVSGIRLGLGGVEDAPRVFVGSDDAVNNFKDFVEQSMAVLRPTDDPVCDAPYRLALARKLGLAVIVRALERAGLHP